jgi:hypothetical protein
MAMTEEKVTQILETIIKENNIGLPIKAVVYRDDYQDYFIVVGKVHYCEIREKLFDVYSRTQDGDACREIVFKLKHPVELDEWRKMELGIEDDDDDINSDGVTSKGKGEKPKIVVENKDENDWI